MNEIVSRVATELKSASNTPTGNHMKTGDIRKLSAWKLGTHVVPLDVSLAEITDPAVREGCT